MVSTLTQQDGRTAIDVGSEADDVKEALLAYRFSGEEMEDEFLQERIPALVERVTVSSRLSVFGSSKEVDCHVLGPAASNLLMVLCRTAGSQEFT